MKVTDVEYIYRVGSTFVVEENGIEYRGMISYCYLYPDRSKVYISGQEENNKAMDIRNRLQEIWDKQLEKYTKIVVTKEVV